MCLHIVFCLPITFSFSHIITPGNQSYTFTSPVSRSNKILLSKRGDGWWRGFILQVWTQSFLQMSRFLPLFIYIFSRQRCTHRNTCRESRLTAAPHFISKLCEPPFSPEESLVFASDTSCLKRCFEAAQLFGAPPHSMSSVVEPQQELPQPCK